MYYLARILLFCSIGFISNVYSSTPPPLTLALVYQTGVNLQEYLVSEKFDGVRAYWDGERLLTRSGNEFPAPRFFLLQLPPFALDGELWFGYGEFARANALVHRLPNHSLYEAEWREVRYLVFDTPSFNAPFNMRYQQLVERFSNTTGQLQVVKQWSVDSEAQLFEQLKKVVDQGGEGLMLQKRNALYRVGRTMNVLKLKWLEDAEATVIGHIPGRGKLDGKMGALLVRMENGQTFRLGTGFSDAERDHPPALGTTITFVYQGLTEHGLPRFARFLRIREQPHPPISAQ